MLKIDHNIKDRENVSTKLPTPLYNMKRPNYLMLLYNMYNKIYTKNRFSLIICIFFNVEIGKVTKIHEQRITVEYCYVPDC